MAQETTSESSSKPLLLKADLNLDLTSGQVRLIEVQIPADSAAVVSVEQTLGSVETREVSSTASEDTEPRINSAGLHSKIVLHLIAHTDGAKRLSIRNPSSTKPATVSVKLIDVHPSTPQDIRQAEAEAALAHAESLRTKRLAASYPEALRSYDWAITIWRSLNDERNLARALTWKAMFLFVNQSDAKAALPLTDEATASMSRLEDVEAANCAKTAGYINVQLGRYEPGRSAYALALQLFERTHDLFNQEVMLDNRSRLERLQGNTDAALTDAQKADVLANQLGDLRGQLRIQAELGAINIGSSRLEAAYTAYQKALALLKQYPDATTEGYVWSDLGVLYTLLHEFDRAHNALDQAMAVWKRSPNPTGEVNTLDDFGELWMGQHSLPLARTYYRQGLALATTQSLPRAEIYLLRGLGASYLMDNHLVDAEKNLEQALALALQTKEGDGLPEIYCLLGDLHVRRHQNSQAEQSYQLCGKTAASSHDTSSTIRSQGSLARLKLTQGDVDGAMKYSEQSLMGIENASSAIPEQELRTTFFSSMRSYYDLAIEILEQSDGLHPNETYAWQAFLTAERARSRMLLDQVQTQPDERPKASPALVAELEGIDTAFRNHQRRLTSSSLTMKQQKDVKSAIAQLTIRRDALSAELTATNGGSDSGSMPLTLESLQAVLPGPQSVLLEYWIGQHASFLWAISRDGVRSFRLADPATLNVASAALLRTIRSVATLDPTITAEQRAVLIPAKLQFGKTQILALRALLLPSGSLPHHVNSLLIVGDGPLLSVPFAVLMKAGMGCGTRAPASSACDIVSEPSAAFLQQLLVRPAAPSHPPRIAVFTGSTQHNKTSPSEISLPADLPFASNEAKSIQTVFRPENTRLLAADEATPEAIRNFPWSEYTIAHFATHALLNRQNMQLTGIVLNSPEKADSSDGPMLWYGDICRMHSRLELVVLSACDTANGQDIPGEGLVGLSQAFFMAGSQRVLGSLWPVDDEATSLLMQYFYTYLRSTGSPSTALRMAQDKMAGTASWQAPYYWAGFSLAGDWRKLP